MEVEKEERDPVNFSETLKWKEKACVGKVGLLQEKQ